LNASELTDPGKDVITIQMSRVATTAESLKIGNQQKTQNPDLGKLGIIPNTPGNQEQPVFTQIIVPIWIPLQRNHSAPHGSQKARSTKEVEPTRPPIGGDTLNGNSNH